jgi:putative nucleotidyltransferase with HDIG domain
MDRNEALGLVRAHVSDAPLITHSVATAAVMKALAPHFSGDADVWELIGLLHDIDYTLVSADMTRHGGVGCEILRRAGVPEEIAGIVKRHNHHLYGENYREPVEIALQAADSASGLIIACALVKGRRLSEVTPKTVAKKFREKSFAAGCDRKRIRLIEPLMDLDRFYEIAISGLMEARNELGLV